MGGIGEACRATRGGRKWEEGTNGGGASRNALKMEEGVESWIGGVVRSSRGTLEEILVDPDGEADTSKMTAGGAGCRWTTPTSELPPSSFQRP